MITAKERYRGDPGAVVFSSELQREEEKEEERPDRGIENTVGGDASRFFCEGWITVIELVRAASHHDAACTEKKCQEEEPHGIRIFNRGDEDLEENGQITEGKEIARTGVETVVRNETKGTVENRGNNQAQKRGGRARAATAVYPT